MAAVDVFVDVGVDLYHAGTLTDGLELLAARLDYAGAGELLTELMGLEFTQPGASGKGDPKPAPTPRPPAQPKPPPTTPEGLAVMNSEANRRRHAALIAGLVDPLHGTRSTYVHYMCRCDECKAANSNYQRRAARERRDRLAVNDGSPVHGRYTTYQNWMCRCEDCSIAHSRYLRSRRSA